MAEAKDIPPGEYEFKLGSTFSEKEKKEKPVYHTLRYDFKPQSVAASDSESFIAMGGNGDVHIAVPTGDESLTVYKGAQKPVKADKECLLFFDHRTGTVRLEKLNTNISVKKTRDIDPGTEQSLRNQIARLRTSSKQSSQVPSSSLSSDPSACLPIDESSSGSSSSSSSDSDSGSESEVERQNVSRLHRTSSSSTNILNDSGSDDDELDKALESEMKAVSSTVPSVRNNPNVPSSLGDFDSMPSFDLSLSTIPIPNVVDKPATVSKSFSTQKREKELMNDLQLSESSDED